MMEFFIIIAIIAMIVYTVLQYKNYQKTQAELTSFAESLDRTGNNLLYFNSQVESNLNEAKQTLGAINISYAELRNMMYTISQMKTNEIAEYQQRKQTIARAADSIDRSLTETVSALTASAQQQLSVTKKTAGVIDDTMQDIVEKMREHTETQLGEFSRAVITQKDNLLKKLEEETILAEELRNLSSIKQGITTLEAATLLQNQKIDNLCTVIEQFMEMQGGGKKGSLISKLTGK